jgi:hypothetical protein
MRRYLGIILFAVVALASPTVVSANDITYNVNQTEGVFGVTGTVTTDGTIGTLSTSDIAAWDLTLSSPGYWPAISLDTANSTATVVGGALSASASQLAFDFTFGGSNSYLSFSDPTDVSWWDTVSQPPYAGYMGIAELYALDDEQYSYISGTQVIADGGIPVAEPGTTSLLLVGVGMLGIMMVTRKRISLGHQQTA